MAKNVLPKHWNGSEFEELHIVTKASNVFTNDNKSVQQKIDNLTPAGIGAVSKSGDTMTGALDAPDLKVNGVSVYHPNNKPSASDVGAVPTSRTINNKALSSDISLSAGDVGLGNVDNVKQMPIAGGTFTGAVVSQANTSYTTRQLRNVVMSTGNPSGGSNGDIWIKYV